MTYFGQRVEEWDDGTLADQRRGRGRLTLDTRPSGAQVTARRLDRDGLTYVPGPPVALGATPLRDVPMDMGSYVLTLSHPEHEDIVYPVEIGRLGHWSPGAPLHLPRPGDVADGYLFVAGGPYRSGGDMEAQDAEPPTTRSVPSFAIARFPVSQGEYCDFINALHLEDPDAAWARVPRADEGVAGSTGQYWDRAAPGEEYVVPEFDRMGDRWDPRWPTLGVSWDDAVAYAEWLSERDGRRYSLPTETQWEKAARGVDGRLFPWGDGFDPSLCLMRLTKHGRPQPEVMGSYPTDISVYGVRDVGGGVRTWCADVDYGGSVDRRPVRGGSWDSHEQYCRIGHRTGYQRTYVGSSFGFRLVHALDEGDGR